MSVAVVDIGSNSVRLVVYEASSRAPIVVFNEKATSGLGRGVATTRRLPADGVKSALAALSRFRALSALMPVSETLAFATAAARDAEDGPAFLVEAQARLGAPISILSGGEEARLAALGVVASIAEADGVVGDLGGGSLELTEIAGGAAVGGQTLAMGALTLADLSGRDPRKAARLARDTLADAPALARLGGRDFYAVGGAWRALARLHMRAAAYPLPVMHNYAIPVDARLDFVRLVASAVAERPQDLKDMPAARRVSLAYGAAALDEIVRRGGPRRIVVSTQGVREGLLFDRLAIEQRAEDPLLAGAAQLNAVHARDAAHADELFAWVSRFYTQAGVDETARERRLRRAACLLADVAWRAHPELRAETAFAMILNSGLVGLEHAERVTLALSASCRHVADIDALSHPACALMSPRQTERARRLGAAMRVGFVLSTGRAGALPHLPLSVESGRVVLALPRDKAALGAERLENRLRALARLFGGDAQIRAG